jgi:hypothetical protein
LAYLVAGAPRERGLDALGQIRKPGIPIPFRLDLKGAVIETFDLPALFDGSSSTLTAQISGNATFTLDNVPINGVVVIPETPVITLHPVTQTVTAGVTVVLGVEAGVADSGELRHGKDLAVTSRGPKGGSPRAKTHRNVTAASHERREHLVKFGVIQNKKRTFLELYCSQHRIEPEDFPKVVFRHALHLHARPFVTLTTLLKRYHFAADYDFINNIGQLTRYRDFDFYMQGFSRHPRNCGFLRRGLRLRLSSRRLRVIIRDLIIQEKKRRATGNAGDDEQPLVHERRPLNFQPPRIADLAGAPARSSKRLSDNDH